MLQLDAYATLVAATLVLLLGRLLVNKIGPLRTFNIPKPVAGGLVVALVLLVLRSTLQIELQFDTSLQTALMLTFFASIGLSADLGSLKRGGKAVATFLLVVTGLLLVQNSLGVGLATLLGLDPHMGLLAGSITLSGGHGTGAAWGSIFTEKYGVQSAAELAIACATFGLVLGGLIGGPVARYLVKKVQVPGEEHNRDGAPQGFEMPDMERPLTTFSLIETLALIAISLKGGEMLALYLKGGVFELPIFVCVLFVGVLLRNLLTLLNWHEVSDREVSLLGNVSLSLFLAMALMSLRLWSWQAWPCPSSSCWPCRRWPWRSTPSSSPSGSWGATMMRPCWRRVTAASASAPPPRPLPTCRPSTSALAPPTCPSWWCPWSVLSSSTSSTPW